MRMLNCPAIVGLISVLAIGSAGFAYPQRAAATQTPVQFKVAGRWSTAVAVVVAQSTADLELIGLINRLRTARATASLATLIPPTTPNGSRGPYGIVMVYVLSDPAWATGERLRTFINSSAGSLTQKQFGSRIRAYYYFTALANKEIGSIGFDDGFDGFRSPNYRKLF